MSNIDITKPVTGTPTTQSVRDNFATAATEIDAAQAAADAAQVTADNALALGGSSTLVVEGFDFNILSGNNFVSLDAAHSANQVFGYFIFQDPPADGDIISFTINSLAPGNYLMRKISVTSGTSGIIESYIDGVLVNSTNQYSVGTVNNVSELTPVTIFNPSTLFEYRVNGKSPASTNFHHAITRVTLRLL